MITIPLKATTIVVAFLFRLTLILVLSFTSSLAATEVTNKSDKINTSPSETSSEQTKAKNHSTYLSIGNEFDTPKTQAQEIFDCTDKVFAVVELENYSIDKHHLSVRWVDPNGTTREHTQYDFHVRAEDTRLWAWLSLSRGFGSGMLQWVNPAAGLEEFIGIWEIDVKIDGKRIGKDNFEVSC